MPPRTNKTFPEPRKTSRRFIFGWLLFGLACALAILANHQAVYDWIRLQGYNAPSDIAMLASDDKLTTSAKRIFYVNHPLLQSKSAFANSCPNGDKETAVLGCYIPIQRGIYVLHVTDVRLAGIEQVTAAHEMLHAAYDRLNDKDKRQLDSWLTDYYQHSLTDPVIIDQMNSYKKSEPNDLLNEMHSIFGTEVTNLPSNLENYYKRYFSDRQKVTGYYTTYEAEFSSRINQIKQDDTQLAGLKMQIQADESDLKTKQAQLNVQQAQLDAARRSGNLTAYNNGVPAYNTLVDAYNAEVATIKSLVDQYNTLVVARNAIALEEQQLTQAISSSVSPISSQ